MEEQKTEQKITALLKKKYLKPLYLFIFLFLLVMAIFFSIYISSFKIKNKTKSSFPLYEDFSQTELEEGILNLNQSITKLFPQLGLKKQEWQERLIRKSLEGKTYPFIEIYAKKPKNLAWSDLKMILFTIVKEKPEVTVQFDIITSKRWEAYFAWHSLISHHLIFNEYLPKVLPKKPRIAIIVDDLGYDIEVVKELLNLEIPLTYSILPYLPHSHQIAELLHRQQADILLHLPLEADGNHPKLNSQKGMLFLNMPQLVLRKQLIKNLEAVPFVKGVNTHMGSKFTKNKAYMSIVLEELKKRNLFFIDSLTTPKSVAFELAKEMGIMALRRDIFLDATTDVESIRRRSETLTRWAKTQGSVLATCHPHLTT
jgi:polysaccharide deacetylase 2 family uncharacterized protein YibQ